MEARKERLRSNASAWSFSIVPVPADGNCFFTAVALALVQDIATSKPILNRIAGVDTNGSIVALAARLRELVVTEWLGPNRLEYENFLTNLDTEYENEASDFLEDGHYDSNLGNTMPLAMSNALGVSLVILTSLPSTPCFYITPRSEPPTQLGVNPGQINTKK